MRGMNLALWIVQALLAFGMAMAGGAKVATPKEKLELKMHLAKTWEPGRLKLLGAAEMLGAVGLIAPGVTGILPVLTPIAAGCLAVLMAGAVKTHIDLKETPAPPAVLGVLCIVVAIGRSGIVH